METEVSFADDKLKHSFDKLKETDQQLYDELVNAFTEISKDGTKARAVRKKLIPKPLTKKYGINNLWIYNLRNGWRLLYSLVTPSKVEVLAIVLDWMTHKEYERLFKF